MIFYFLFSILLNGSYAQDIFGPLVADPKPDRITRDTHYLKSNEYHHDIYKDYIEDLGGIFMGVGTDQLYVMAGWCKPEILIPFDFDQYVVVIYCVYGIIVTKAKAPEDFIQLWQEDTQPPINLIVTPHTAFYSDAGLLEMRTKAAMELKRILTGQNPKNCVNVEFLP